MLYEVITFTIYINFIRYIKLITFRTKFSDSMTPTRRWASAATRGDGSAFKTSSKVV